MHVSALPQKVLRVLIVDSHLDSRDLLVTLFDQYGIEAVGASSVSEALKAMKQTYPTLIISEISLPDEDGYSLIRKVKLFEERHHIQIPAIALTVCVGDKDRKQALAAGFKSHLPKPLDIDQLIATMVYIIEQPQGVVTKELSVKYDLLPISLLSRRAESTDLATPSITIGGYQQM